MTTNNALKTYIVESHCCNSKSFADSNNEVIGISIQNQLTNVMFLPPDVLIK